MRVDLESFEELYASSSDPWQFRTSPYEQRKYAITIASLPRNGRTGGAMYKRCFEPGCSVGALTERLAGVAETVVAQDASTSAIAHAVRRLEPFQHVEIGIGAIPEAWPDGSFDLVVFSEIGYYWDEGALAEIADRLSGVVEPGGDLIAVHWRGQSPDHLLSGDAVHDILRDRLGPSAVHHVESGFLLDVWTAP